MKLTLRGCVNGYRTRESLRSILVPFLFLPIVTGLILPWERGYLWSSSGWDIVAGRMLAVVMFCVAWAYAIYVAGGIKRTWYLTTLLVLALLAAGLPTAYYALEVGRRDPRVIDGFATTHPGVGLGATFVGGIVLGVFVFVESRLMFRTVPVLG